MGPSSFQWCPATEQGAMGTNWSTGSSVWTWRRTSSLWGWRSTGTGCPGRLWSLLQTLEIFKTHLDKVLCSLLRVTLLQQEGWTRWPTEVPSNPYYSVILFSASRFCGAGAVLTQSAWHLSAVSSVADQAPWLCILFASKWFLSGMMPSLKWPKGSGSAVLACHLHLEPTLVFLFAQTSGEDVVAVPVTDASGISGAKSAPSERWGCVIRDSNNLQSPEGGEQKRTKRYLVVYYSWLFFLSRFIFFKYLIFHFYQIFCSVPQYTELFAHFLFTYAVSSSSWIIWLDCFSLPCKVCPFHPYLDLTKLSPSWLLLIPWFFIHLTLWSLCCCCSFEDDLSLLPQTASEQIYNFYFPLQYVCVLLTLLHLFCLFSSLGLVRAIPILLSFFFSHPHHW